MPVLLDLCCKAGGASAGYVQAGYTVVGCDIEPQPRYPWHFMRWDFRNLSPRWIRRQFDAIHLSPPCQKFTAYRRTGHGVGEGYPNLIPAARELARETGLPYVIENVPGAPLEDPVQYCGSSFGLDIRRHRLFESNVPLEAPPCDHSWQTPRFPPASNRVNLRRTVEIGVYRIPLAVQKKAMGGLDWMTRNELSNAVPPAYTEHIGRQLLALNEAAA